MKLEPYLNKIQTKEPLQEFIILPTIVLLIKAYTRHLSKAAKSCIGHSRISKTICILEYRLRATQRIQRDLEKLRIDVMNRDGALIRPFDSRHLQM